MNVTIDHTGVTERLGQRYAVLGESFRGEQTYTVRKQDLLDILTALKNDAQLQFNYLVDITGTDTRPLNGAYTLCYHLLSHKNKLRIRLKVLLDPGDLTIESATSIWLGANFQEREIWDLVGIRFLNHPDLTRLYLPDDFTGHPLRKDYSPWAQDTDIEGFRG